MPTYRIYLESSLTGIPERLSLKKEADFNNDSEARAAFITQVMTSFSDAYAVSATMMKVVDGKEEKVI